MYYSFRLNTKNALIPPKGERIRKIEAAQIRFDLKSKPAENVQAAHAAVLINQPWWISGTCCWRPVAAGVHRVRHCASGHHQLAIDSVEQRRDSENPAAAALLSRIALDLSFMPH